MNEIFKIGGRYNNSPMQHNGVNKITFPAYLASKGRRITEDTRLCDIFIALDHNENDVRDLEEGRKNGKFLVLFRSEPKCVLPIGYKSETMNLYDLVITFGKPESDMHSLHWPQHWLSEEIYEPTSKSRSDSVVMINANKLSLAKGELYSLRRKCAAEIDSLELYGEGWNRSTMSKLKALIIEILKNPLYHSLSLPTHLTRWFNGWPPTLAPENKYDILKMYKYALIIENERTYMSEKLFDALTSGCIPIYVGPQVANYGIPNNLVIEVEPTVNSIVSGIKAARMIDFTGFQEKIQLWLSLDETKQNHKSEHKIDCALDKVHKSYKQFKQLF